jgi:hypothetical protein
MTTTAMTITTKEREIDKSILYMCIKKQLLFQLMGEKVLCDVVDDNKMSEEMMMLMMSQ